MPMHEHQKRHILLAVAETMRNKPSARRVQYHLSQALGWDLPVDDQPLAQWMRSVVLEALELAIAEGKSAESAMTDEDIQQFEHYLTYKR